MHAAPTRTNAVAWLARRAPWYGAALALVGIGLLVLPAWPTRARNPQMPGVAISLIYTAVVLGLVLSARARTILDSIYRMPVCGYVVLVLYAAVVAQKIGHWPWYSHPDPKDLHWPFATAPVALVTIVAILAIPFGTIALLGIAIARAIRSEFRAHRSLLFRRAAWLGAGAGLWTCDIVRGGLLSWIMD